MEIVVGLAIIVCAVIFVLIWLQLKDIHHTMNSRLDQLVVKTDKLARAEGFKAGQENMQALRDFEIKEKAKEA